MAKKQLPEDSKKVLEVVNEVVKGGRYFIAIVEFDQETATLNFHYTQHQFPNSEVFPALKKVSELYKEENMKVLSSEK